MTCAFQRGEYVKYSTNGVCLVEDITAMGFNPYAKDALYYILAPISASSTKIFVPVDNELLVSKMRRLLTKEEIDEIIVSVDTNILEWPEDRKARTNYFTEIIKSDCVPEMLSLAATIYAKRAELNAAGKKLLATENNVLEQIERLIENEFTFVLKLTPAETNEYIKKKMR